MDLRAKNLGDLIEERDRTGNITSVIYWGDNLNVLETLPSNSVDLIYLDPPFSPDRKYWNIWGENDEALSEAYEEACSGGKTTYIRWIGKRVELMRHVLRPDGSFYFHCDPQLGHYFKVMLDRVFGDDESFGYDHFQNEIVWWYGGGGASKRRFGRKHDTVFFYTKSNEDIHTFNVDEVREPYKEAWTRGQKRADGSERTLEKGKLPDDVWRMHGIMPWAEERTGYPTQKPENLIEKIIRASSNPGDIILDPFCGCGTTPVAAYNLNRKWIGIDLAERGCRTMSKRLGDLEAPYCIVPWELRERQLKKLERLSGNEFKNWVTLRIQGRAKRGTDGGVDLYTDKGEPVQVKKWEAKIGPGVLRDFRTALRSEERNNGYIVSFSGFTKGAVEEANKARDRGLEIGLVKVGDIDEFF